MIESYAGENYSSIWRTPDGPMPYLLFDVPATRVIDRSTDVGVLRARAHRILIEGR